MSFRCGHSNPGSEALSRALAAACFIAFAANGCSRNTASTNTLNIGGSHASGGSSTNAIAGGTSSVNKATGGIGANGGVCSAPGTRTNRHVGNYDYESCSKCHDSSWRGGWLYNNTAGDDWVAGATVTVTNGDGSKMTAITEAEGFFYLEGWTVGSTFIPCVSKCPYTLCATKAHTSGDCQTAGCHGDKNNLIYLPQDSPAQNTGGASSTSNCTPPASGGPRVHSALDYDSNDQSCRICHDSTYTGGYVYDGVTSNNVISMATVTIQPTNGTTITVVSGPGGMFFLGQYGATNTTIPLTAPYKACVSKCPKTVCSSESTHTTTDNCGDCHNDQLRIYLN